MGQLPKLNNVSPLRKSYQVAFGGLNHNIGASDGEIYDMKNMSADHYPVLTQREKRRLIHTLEAKDGAVYAYGGCIIYIDNDELLRVIYPWYVDSAAGYPGMTACAVEAGEKVFAGFRNRIIVFPDKIAVDVSAKGEFISLADLQLTITKPNSGDTYLVGTGPNADLYGWNGGEWVYIGKQVEELEKSITTRVTFLHEGLLYGEKAENNTLHGFNARFDELFNVGDAVTISGCNLTNNNKTAIIREIDGDYLRFYEYVFDLPVSKYVYTAKEDLSSAAYGQLSVIPTYGFDNGEYSFSFYLPYDVLAGTKFEWTIGASAVKMTALTATGWKDPVDIALVDAALIKKLDFMEGYDDVEENRPVKISRNVPDMDFIISDDNRLWGAKGNTLYASKLGDPNNFNVFDGLSTDSFSVEMGNAGNITAAVTYGGYPTFFKEDGIYRVYGDKPSNYQIMPSMKEGVKEGCAKSLAVAGEVLYYISRSGIMAYTGGVPAKVDEPLGIRVLDGVGVSDGQKYYISAYDGEKYGLFVYDTAKGLWHKEDDLHLTYAVYDDEVLGLTEDGELLALVRGSFGTEEDDLSWLVEFADMTYGSPFQKGIVKLNIRFDLEPDAEAKAEISYDGDDWEMIREFRGTGKRSNVLPIIPHRCDHFRLRMRGTGVCDIYSLAVQYYHGSENY